MRGASVRRGVVEELRRSKTSSLANSAVRLRLQRLGGLLLSLLSTRGLARVLLLLCQLLGLARCLRLALLLVVAAGEGNNVCAGKESGGDQLPAGAEQRASWAPWKPRHGRGEGQVWLSWLLSAGLLTCTRSGIGGRLIPLLQPLCSLSLARVTTEDLLFIYLAREVRRSSLTGRCSHWC